MTILVSWLIIIGIALMVWGGYVYSYSKIVRHENLKLKDKLAHVETELANLKSKTNWDNY
ncbi:hypothetical protein [Lactococcus lactis]|uniref:hypothetical protein n=1 Tax=Lactococcus lactis TaxID=1358 RepID=UPI002890B55E|nr:hypothetical protein [Lactococcus lactis]MDT2878107.1 hypothetical protein [Lactococcus lactis]MDT2885921.1 hypothetical protein [Lactococcus lactis]MDT2902178.1 hypothetical protein [Lactococcus lactis]MDT2928982.1 hypothetical protein [Lactococcus lactis]